MVPRAEITQAKARRCQLPWGTKRTGSDPVLQEQKGGGGNGSVGACGAECVRGS